ncbi:MAG TPA: hypothetical protein VFG73_07615 [Rhodanobacteraceae bacterium]|nr:hypothetical protein [Rhodanobacteraceae bacterium]
MREFDDLMPTLEPPPGGLARLQRHIAASPSRGPLRWPRLVAAPALLAAALALALWLPPQLARQQRQAALTQTLRQALSPRLPPSGIAVAHGGAIELPSGQANVRLYLVQTSENGGNQAALDRGRR